MTKQLMKSINEEYFKYYTDIIPRPSTNIDDIKRSIDIVPDKEIGKLLTDLLNFLTKDNFVPISSVGTEIHNNIIKQSKKVKRKLDISIKYNPVLAETIDLLKGTNTCLVGGAIRDILTGKVPKDFDFCTDVPIEKLEEIFTTAGFKIQSEGKQFLVLIVSKNSESFEIANFRKDADNSGGSIGTIEEDSRRRDFTVGALYYDLSKEKLLDYNESLTDLQNNILKFVGNPEIRIKEDPNRVFRFYRFISKGFVPDKKSLKACRRHFEFAILNTSANRIMNEIERIVL